MSDTALDIRTQSATLQSESVADYVELLKPRVMSLVVFSGFVGLAVAPGEIHWFQAAVAVLCIAVAAGGSGAINMWYDRDIDAAMSRTKSRPIPSGRVEPAEALSLGVILSIFSVAIMGMAVNWTAAALLAGANLFYVFIYTIWLKRRTPQNIVIGGAAGAFPPMIGWAAVTGGVSLESLLLFLLIFLWTPPHFWALALYKMKDYHAAGVPMLPNVAGAAATKRQILLYSLLLFPVALAPAFLGTAGWLYGAAAVLLGLLLILASVRVLQAREEDEAPAKRLFGFSILYLFLLFSLLLLDAAHGPLSLSTFLVGA